MKARIALALAMSFFVGACVTDTSAEDDSTVDSSPRLASNGMLPTAIQPTNVALQALTTANLTNNPIVTTASGRSYLSYLVDCALPSGVSVSVTYGFTKYTFPGNIGVAPAWTTRGLTSLEGNWISACVISRANLTGTQVQISMRGSIPLWGTTTDEAANYNVEEGAFYGNVWTGNFGQMHACNGVDQVRDGDTYGDLGLRQCAQPDPNNPGYTPCGFVFDGNCADICTRSTSGDYFTSCNGNTYVVTSRLYGTAP